MAQMVTKAHPLVWRRSMPLMRGILTKEMPLERSDSRRGGLPRRWGTLRETAAAAGDPARSSTSHVRQNEVPTEGMLRVSVRKNGMQCGIDAY